jgi:GNAT superfamily N-acetyltransferase
VTDAVRSVAREGRDPAAEAFAERLSGGETLQRRDAERRRVVYVATSNAVCRWAHLEAFTRSRLRHTATLTGVVVEALRGAGVGSELPEYAAEWAASRGYEKLYRNVSGANRARTDFLTERGWAVEATTRRPPRRRRVLRRRGDPVPRTRRLRPDGRERVDPTTERGSQN